MRYRCCGYSSPSRKLEDHVMRSVKYWAPIILEDQWSQIKEVRVTFHKHPIPSWDPEFRRLWLNGVVHMKIPGKYRTHYRAEWLVGHELCHAKQMIMGKLRPFKNTWYYRRRLSHPFTVYKDGGHWSKIINMETGWLYDDWSKNPWVPWEVECNRWTDEYMGKNLGYLAWGC